MSAKWAKMLPRKAGLGTLPSRFSPEIPSLLFDSGPGAAFCLVHIEAGYFLRLHLHLHLHYMRDVFEEWGVGVVRAGGRFEESRDGKLHSLHFVGDGTYDCCCVLCRTVRRGSGWAWHGFHGMRCDGIAWRGLG